MIGSKDLMDDRSLSFTSEVSGCYRNLSEQSALIVEELLNEILIEVCTLSWLNADTLPVIDKSLVKLCADDLLAFYEKDPSSVKDIVILARSSTSYAAVIHYRVAHWIRKQLYIENRDSIGAMISRRGKVISGAEIHYKCTIGERSILDHGVGTVIGETSSIGDDCYMLGGVTLGSRRIANNTSELRHPNIGSRVQIGMNASVIGVVRVGDDCFIGADCAVFSDVIPKSRVTIRKSCLITHCEEGLYNASN